MPLHVMEQSVMLRVVRVLAPEPERLHARRHQHVDRRRRSVDRDRPGAARPGSPRARCAPTRATSAAVLVTHDHEDHGEGAVAFARARRRAGVRRGGCKGATRLTDGQRFDGRRGRARSPCTRRGTAPTTSPSSSRPRARCSPATPSWAAARASSIRPTATSRGTSRRCIACSSCVRGRSTRDTVRCVARRGGEAPRVHRPTARSARSRCSPGSRPATGPCATWSSGSTRATRRTCTSWRRASVTAHLLKLERDGARAQERPRRLADVGAPGAGGVRSMRPAGAWAEAGTAGRARSPCSRAKRPAPPNGGR